MLLSLVVCQLLVNGLPAHAASLRLTLAKVVVEAPDDSKVAVVVTNSGRDPFTIWEGAGLKLEILRGNESKGDAIDWNILFPPPSSIQDSRFDWGSPSTGRPIVVPFTIRPGASLHVGRKDNLTDAVTLKRGPYRIRAVHTGVSGDMWLVSDWVKFEVSRDLTASSG